jgi:hypothetical protein
MTCIFSIILIALLFAFEIHAMPQIKCSDKSIKVLNCVLFDATSFAKRPLHVFEGLANVLELWREDPEITSKDTVQLQKTSQDANTMHRVH